MKDRAEKRHQKKVEQKKEQAALERAGDEARAARKKRLRWWGRIIGPFLLCSLMLSGSGWMERVFPAEVALVLGNEVYTDGTCSPRLAARLDRAVELYRDKLCEVIIVSGGVGKSGQDEATAMRRYLLEREIPDAAIVTDSSGVNTRASAVFTAAYMKERNYTKVMAVSQYFHLPRARLALDQEGILEVGSARPEYFEWRDFYSVPRELPAYLIYLFHFK